MIKHLDYGIPYLLNSLYLVCYSYFRLFCIVFGFILFVCYVLTGRIICSGNCIAICAWIFLVSLKLGHIVEWDWAWCFVPIGVLTLGCTSLCGLPIEWVNAQGRANQRRDLMWICALATPVLLSLMFFMFWLRGNTNITWALIPYVPIIPQTFSRSRIDHIHLLSLMTITCTVHILSSQ
jgi:hypothetical protein